MWRLLLKSHIDSCHQSHPIIPLMPMWQNLHNTRQLTPSSAYISWRKGAGLRWRCLQFLCQPQRVTSCPQASGTRCRETNLLHMRNCIKPRLKSVSTHAAQASRSTHIISMSNKSSCDTIRHTQRFQTTPNRDTLWPPVLHVRCFNRVGIGLSKRSCIAYNVTVLRTVPSNTIYIKLTPNDATKTSCYGKGATKHRKWNCNVEICFRNAL